MAILDQYGNPIAPADIAEPQTARIAALQHQMVESHLDGLTPAMAARILRDADLGNIVAQHELFDDMLDRDAHLRCEYDKRVGAVVGLDWSIEPPANATAAEKAAAQWVEETLRHAVDDLEDCLGAMMEAPGHGFSPIELEWTLVDGMRLPRFHPRPQTWFRLDPMRRELRLADGSGQGAVPVPFGWIVHHARKVKTGYLGRAGLFRAVLWPFLYKAYSIGDFAEFLEVYGLPFIVGKYSPGANADEKASLLRAVSALGRDARAIMPDGMAIELQKVTAGGDGSHHLSMVGWADGAQSKAILGQVLSAEAKATGMGSGVADLHAEVRQDILAADARQMAGTLTRDLIYPLIALNRPGIHGLTRCPRWVFDTGTPEDLKAYAEALPTLAENGARIPVRWVHDKLRIPEAAEDEQVFGKPAAQAGIENDESGAPTGKESAQKFDASLINAYSMGIDRFSRLGMKIPERFIRDVFGIPTPAPGERALEPVDQGDKPAALAALAGEAPEAIDPVDALLAVAMANWREDMTPMVDPIQAAVEAALDRGDTAEQFLERLPGLLQEIDADVLAERLTRAAFAARLAAQAD